MNVSGIYKIQSIIKPEKVYIGSAKNINRRKGEHFNNLKNNKHHSKKLQNHYNKYGESDLQFSILLGCEKEDLLKHEQFFIDSYKPWFYVCLIAGNCLGVKHSDETKRKHSISHLGVKNGMYGKKHSEEIKQRRRESLLGTKLPDEIKQKISNKLKGRVFSEETRKKMGEWQRGIKRESLSEERKKKLLDSIKGHKQSEEHIRRRFESRKGYKHSIETKKKIADTQREKARRLKIAV